jgi:hypothetical protein
MKKQFGNSFRAWRQALDLDGSMNLQRAELFKASPDRGDVEVDMTCVLWKMYILW